MTTMSYIIVSDLDLSNRILFKCKKFWGASLMIHWLTNLIKEVNKCKHTAVSNKYCNETPFVPWHAAMFMKTSQLSSFRAPAGTACGGCVWLTDKLSAWPTRRQTSYLAAQWVNRSTGLSACHTHIQLILQTAWKVCLTDAGCPTRKHRNGQGPCTCDSLALWKQVQWKIVPTANPWQANYSFDPHGKCITIGGREAVDSVVQYICLFLFWFKSLWENWKGLPTLVNRLIPHYN